MTTIAKSLAIAIPCGLFLHYQMQHLASAKSIAKIRYIADAEPDLRDWAKEELAIQMAWRNQSVFRRMTTFPPHEGQPNLWCAFKDQQKK